MLVAKRDPFEAGTQEPSYAYDAAGRPRLARTVSMLQVVGSLLAIPVGLASAYSVYRANFSVETTCQSLRADILTMIDKRVDASTRRILARRDIEHFEQTCGLIDPDATAAFKRLLAVEKPAAASVAVPVLRATEAPAKDPAKKDVAHRDEPKPQTIAKMPDSAWPGGERAKHEARVSDTQWLDAVRQALVTHETRRATAEPENPPAPVAMPVAVPVLRSTTRETALPVQAAPVAVPAAPVAASAPALPPAATVATPAAPPPVRQQADADHPVPPEAIPDPAQVAAAEADDHRSRVRRWISKIPLMGNVIDNGLQ